MSEEVVFWLERTLPRLMRRLVGAEDPDNPLLQLPLAQLRLAQALYFEDDAGQSAGETMGQLSEKLGVKHNALTQSADRLVHRGLAERFSDPTDRRLVRMRLTKIGQDWISERRARRRDHLNRLWSLMDESEQETFLQAVHTLDAACNRISQSNDDPVVSEVRGEALRTA